VGAPGRDFNTIVITGAGTVDGLAATIVATCLDNGEGKRASGPDQVAIAITVQGNDCLGLDST
jgi:hypothetical protein